MSCICFREHGVGAIWEPEPDCPEHGVVAVLQRPAIVKDGWMHTRLVADDACSIPTPRPGGELLRAGFCRHCGFPIKLAPEA